MDKGGRGSRVQRGEGTPICFLMHASLPAIFEKIQSNIAAVFPVVSPFFGRTVPVNKPPGAIFLASVDRSLSILPFVDVTLSL